MQVETVQELGIVLPLGCIIGAPNECVIRICPFYAPNFEGVDGAYWFRVVRLCVRVCIRPSKTVHATVLKFHVWIPHGKILDAHFFLV